MVYLSKWISTGIKYLECFMHQGTCINTVETNFNLFSCFVKHCWVDFQSFIISSMGKYTLTGTSFRIIISSIVTPTVMSRSYLERPLVPRTPDTKRFVWKNFNISLMKRTPRMWTRCYELLSIFEHCNFLAIDIDQGCSLLLHSLIVVLFPFPFFIPLFPIHQ